MPEFWSARVMYPTVPSCSKCLILLSISSELSMIGSYILQNSYTTVVMNVTANIIVNKDVVFYRFTQKMFFKISCECSVNGGIS